MSALGQAALPSFEPVTAAVYLQTVLSHLCSSLVLQMRLGPAALPPTLRCDGAPARWPGPTPATGAGQAAGIRAGPLVQTALFRLQTRSMLPLLC